MMKIRDMEDLLVSLFDPQITVSEKVELINLAGGGTRYAYCLDDSDVAMPIDGIEITFMDGSTFQLIIIPLER